MDLEDLKIDLETQLTEIQNQIAELKSSSQSSKSSNELTLIFSKLNDFEKQSNENLKKNADKLNENAKSVYSELSNNANSKLNELKESVKKTQGELQNQITVVADGVGKNISTAEKSFLDTVKNGKAEITKAVAEQRRAIFKTWANCLLFIFLGILLTFVGTVGFNFFKIQDGFYKELAENKKLESIQKQAVADYKKALLADPDHKELIKLIENWKKKNGSK